MSKTVFITEENKFTSSSHHVLFYYVDILTVSLKNSEKARNHINSGDVENTPDVAFI